MFKKMMGMIVLVTLVMVTGRMVAADDILDAITQGKADYESGNSASAMTNLEYAAQLIRQKRGSDLGAYLPKPLEGWEAEDVDNSSYGAAMFGGGTMVQKTYRKGDSSVSIQIATDAVYLSGVIPMFSNPALVTMSGKKLETIAGQKAIVEYAESEKRGTINFVIKDKCLITVEGSEITKEDLWAYAGAVDFAGIAALN